MNLLSKQVKNRYSIFKRIYLWLRKRIVLPIKTGRIKYYIAFFLFQERKEIYNLKEQGFSRIHAIKINDWRIGRGKDKAFRRYYTAYKDETKCFIKIGISDQTVKNEYEILRLEKDKLFFSPLYINGSENFENGAIMIAVEFIDGLTAFDIPGNITQFESVCDQFIAILGTLQKIGIIHADIHKGNLMMKNGKLFLIDYGISKKLDSEENGIDYIARPGTFFREKDGFRTYDDAYSFIQLMNSLGIPDSYKNTSSYNRIVNMVGKNEFIVNISS